MSSPAEFSIRQSVAINLLIVVLLVGGATLYATMTREVMPDVTLEYVSILTLYPGVSPETIEETITAKIEREIADVDGIDEIRSYSLEGRSFILVKAEAEVSDIDEFRMDLQTEVDKVTDLPVDEDREEPVVQDLDYWNQVASIAISGKGIDDRVLRNLAESLKEEVEEISAVGTVVVRGLRDREVHVDVDRNRLYTHGLSLAEVVTAIRNKNVNVAAGTVEPKETGQEIAVGVDTRLNPRSTPLAVEQIKNLVVLSEDTNSVTVGDLARVEDTLEDEVTRARVYSKQTGDFKRSIVMAVSKRKGGNAIKVVDQIREKLAAFQETVPTGISVELVEDNSTYIRARVKTMETSGAIGLALVLLVLGLFINYRLALMAALGIPISFAGAILFMNLIGMTANNISLFSLIVVLGMIVDDAIVVSENVYRYMEKGLSPVRAAIQGTQEVMWPVITTIATTIAAFMPMLLMSGVMGKIMAVIPQVVSICLLVSLIEALFVLPAHMAEFVKPPNRKAARKPNVRDRAQKFLVRSYLAALRACLRWRYSVVPLMFVLAFGVILATGVLTSFNLFPADDIDRFSIRLRAPVGTNLDAMENHVQKFEQALQELPSVMAETSVITSTIGSRLNPRGGMEYAKNFGQLEIHLVDPSERDRVARAIMEEIRSKTEPLARNLGVEIEHDLLNAGPPTGRAVSVELRGEDFIVLQRKADEIKRYLTTVPGVKDIADDFEMGKTEYKFRLREDNDSLARRLGVNAALVSAELRRAVSGEVATSIESGTEEIDVRVKFPDDQTARRTDLPRIRVRNLQGELIDIQTVGSIQAGYGYSQITRRDEKRTITVTADVEMDAITSDEVNKKIIKDFPDGSDFSVELRGEFKETQESLDSLRKAFVVSILVIYLLLGALFKSYIQPVIVMIAIPLAFVGVGFGLLVMGEPRSLMAMIGTVALAGIVVNDSLILVSFINQSRARGVGRWHAVLNAGKLRFRPIILTSATTIFGLMPLAVGVSGFESFLSPMALAVVWGLTFATVLTLIIIPCLYTIFDDIAIYFGFGRFGKPPLSAELDAEPTDSKFNPPT